MDAVLRICAIIAALAAASAGVAYLIRHNIIPAWEFGVETKQMVKNSLDAPARAEVIASEVKANREHQDNNHREVIGTLNKHGEKIDAMQKELHPNHGSSMRDQVDMMKSELSQVKARIDQHVQVCEITLLGAIAGGKRRTDSILTDTMGEPSPADGASE